MAQDWLLWQLADSAFPAGSFAHSGGLEAAWQHNRVERGESLHAFIETALTQTARGSLPFAMASFSEPERFREHDALCHAMLSNHVANRASRAQGQSLLSAAERIFNQPALTELQATARRTHSPMHLAPVFGAVARVLGLEAEQVGRLFLFGTLRGLVSSAVRLGVMGPMEGQSMQARLAPHAERLVQEGIGLSINDAAQTAPMLDLLAGTHDRLYSRLFQS